VLFLVHASLSLPNRCAKAETAPEPAHPDVASAVDRSSDAEDVCSDGKGKQWVDARAGPR
jgi:hypothetical protein